jgi:predicted GIY-YIG superfamily endonuclease
MTKSSIPIWCLSILVVSLVQVSLARQTETHPTTPAADAGQSAQTSPGSSVPLTKLRAAVKSAFEQSHGGWSSDEVILNAELNRAFLFRCKTVLPDVPDVDFNWTLLNLRKAGLLDVVATKRNSKKVGQFAPLAEIAARLVCDRQQVSSDRMMCDPDLKAQFDEVVKSIDPQADLDSVRRAAFQLRKQRQLRPELLLRIADWGREIHSYPLEQVRTHPDLVPELPGIYIFRDHTGYLYIGQTDNLQTRLQTHFSESHNFSLANYLKNQANDNIVLELHSFQADSRAKETMIRRAYESELIASRKPRFNIQP